MWTAEVRKDPDSSISSRDLAETPSLFRASQAWTIGEPKKLTLSRKLSELQSALCAATGKRAESEALQWSPAQDSALGSGWSSAFQAWQPGDYAGNEEERPKSPMLRMMSLTASAVFQKVQDL